MNKYLQMAEQYAREYDLGVEKQSYHGPAVLFGLMFEFLETGDRVLKKNGVFGFTFDEMIPEKSGSFRKTKNPEVSRSKHPESGLYMYRHSDSFTHSLCRESGFEILKQVNFLTFEGKDGYDDFYFTAYIARKK